MLSISFDHEQFDRNFDFEFDRSLQAQSFKHQ